MIVFKEILFPLCVLLLGDANVVNLSLYSLQRSPHGKKSTYRDSRYYHIINRSVDKMNIIFRESNDYEYFADIMFHMKSYGITLYNYCLMSNH